jgi:tocopherol O-methyltransferase
MITSPVETPAKAIEEHYDSLHHFYEDTWGVHLHHGLWQKRGESTGEAVLNLSAAISDLAEVRSGDAVCDIGCGYGGSAIRLAVTRQARVTGITLSKVQCDEAKALAAELSAEVPVPQFICGDWLANALEDASFDAAISIECLLHVADKAAFFREAARVVKPGGNLGMAVWLASEKAGPLAIRHLLEPMCREGRLASLVTASELKTFAESEGFSVEEFSEVGRQVKKTWLVISFRVAGKIVTQKKYRRFLWENLKSDRIFALTVLRVIIAYEIGALQYGLIKLTRRNNMAEPL